MEAHNSFKIAIIGAGAAGLFCAIEAGKKGHSVTVFDHAKKPGEKIRISGGGRCNFTNKYCTPENFISHNKHFCKSALSRYPSSSFISMIEEYKISYHEKNPHNKTGQLFCDGKSQEIIDMLLSECNAVDVKIKLETTITSIDENDPKMTLTIDGQKHHFDKVIIATGGPSIPKMGASDFGYKMATSFGHNIIDCQPALVPLTFTDDLLNFTKLLSGLSIDSVFIKSDSFSFRDDLLFTHRGLSGPVILQISSYWAAGESLTINLLPDSNIKDILKKAKQEQPKTRIPKILNQYLPARFIDAFLLQFLDESYLRQNIADYSDKKIDLIHSNIHNWVIKPNGTEGYRTAEVTRGGINVDEIDAKTFESKKQKNLYFIGEVLDVTGHLGGHNFQWAWASGYCCGQEL